MKIWGKREEERRRGKEKKKAQKTLQVSLQGIGDEFSFSIFFCCSLFSDFTNMISEE
jgi:hypothetical protein